MSDPKRELLAKIVCGAIVAIVGAFGLLVAFLVIGRYWQLYGT